MPLILIKIHGGTTQDVAASSPITALPSPNRNCGRIFAATHMATATAVCSKLSQEIIYKILALLYLVDFIHADLFNSALCMIVFEGIQWYISLQVVSF